MKAGRILWMVIFLFNMGVVMGQTAWKSPDYKPEQYRKVMVLAKISDELTKRQMEDATVKLLGEKGIMAIPAYAHITAPDLASEETLIAKADLLQVDALLVYNITGNETDYKNTPSVNASVGVPVKVGIFRGFLGTNVPITGGSKAVSKIKVTASFYNKTSHAMQWSYPMSGKLKTDNAKLAASLAKQTVNAMIKDNLFI